MQPLHRLRASPSDRAGSQTRWRRRRRPRRTRGCGRWRRSHQVVHQREEVPKRSSLYILRRAITRESRRQLPPPPSRRCGAPTAGRGRPTANSHERSHGTPSGCRRRGGAAPRRNVREQQHVDDPSEDRSTHGRGCASVKLGDRVIAPRMVSTISQAVKKRPSGSSLKRSSLYILRRSRRVRKNCASASRASPSASVVNGTATVPPCMRVEHPPDVLVHVHGMWPPRPPRACIWRWRPPKRWRCAAARMEVDMDHRAFLACAAVGQKEDSLALKSRGLFLSTPTASTSPRATPSRFPTVPSRDDSPVSLRLRQSESAEHGLVGGEFRQVRER